MTDELVWIAQAQKGSDEAFTQLVEAYQTHVYNLCYRMLGEAEAAEDASQETFLRAYQHIHRYDQKRPFGTWLLSIAAHYCIDRLRRRKFGMTSIDQDEDEGGFELPDTNTTSIDQDEDEGGFELPDTNTPNPESEAIYGEQKQQMQKMLKKLDSVDRAAVVMRYWNDCSEIEIAESLNLTVSAVKSRLHRARRALAQFYQAESAPSHHERRPHESPAF